jgi:hypothetical protein
MSEHVTGLNRNQTALFPDTLEEYVDKQNPVRFIDAFIDTINLEKLGFTHSTPTKNRQTIPQPLRPAQALRLQLPKPSKIQQKTRTRMSPQHRRHVSNKKARSKL